MAIRAILHHLGQLITVMALFMLLPLIASLADGDEATAMAFAGAGAVSLFIGFGCLIATRGQFQPPSRRDLIGLCVVGWIVAALCGALPFWFGAIAPSFADAFLEAVSGVTTTGLTIFQSPEALGSGYLLWRALLQWLGGFAFVFVGLTIFPMLGLGGAEVRGGGTIGVGAGWPRTALRQTARRLIVIFAALTGGCLMLLLALDVPFLASLCLAMSTVTTGGFSVQGGPLNPVGGHEVLLALVPFMLIGALGFHIYIGLFARRRQPVHRNPEFRSLFAFLGFGLLVVVPLGFAYDDSSIFDTLVASLFNTVSALTTTGFVAEGTAGTSVVASFVFAGLAFIGASTGSTGSGLKQMRVTLLLKQVGRELRLLIHPSAIVRLKYDGARVTDTAVRAVWTFFVAYLFAMIVLTLALAASDIRFSAALALALATLTNGGQIAAGSAGSVAWQSSLGTGSAWLLSAGMLIGRLELLAVLVLFSRSYWQR